MPNEMQWTGLNELREKFLSFFESKGHLRLGSFSLVPKNDNSLLLINSGMAPMKKYFTGEVTPPRSRVTTCQKCIRTPDIERVGITARHGTYFEMLGNFSFGDYFKEEAIPWAWEFCTEVLHMPQDKLWVTVYQDDDETVKIWTDKVGIPAERIVRMGKEDNFWEHGPGACGPCSEIYFDRGPEHGCGSPDCKVGCECDRYVEFWNVVFSQFNSDGKGNYTLLEHPNIDTGMGLERLACIMQGVDNLFLVDTVRNIMKHVSRISGVEYGAGEKSDISLRVVTDHIRSTTFMIGDGVMPSNEGRGYVLRRLLRRAARHGRLLGIKCPFLTEVAQTVIAENEGAYPELREKQDMILKIIANEEESFSRTIDKGLQILESFIERADTKVLSGDDAFLLNDTYGFPLDLTKEILAERGMTVDEETFHQRMLEQKERARAARKNAGADAWAGEADLLDDTAATAFLGYEVLEADAKILAMIRDGECVSTVSAGDEAVFVLDRTPFYAESGGQVGDTGVIEHDGAQAGVTDTIKNHNGIFLHKATVTAGTFTVGDSVSAKVEKERRMAIMRNHTAAHLLQAALRKVLGTHVEQAGQLVNAQHVRFDFTHFSALTAEELQKVESLVNQEIMSFTVVDSREMPIEEAKKLGAMALFGEKYGNIVRVVRAGAYSLEFCGGTHVDNTAKLGLFKIVSEGSVAAGVRRIEAVTGTGVLALLEKEQKILQDTVSALRLNSTAELAGKAAQMSADLKEKDRVIESLNAKIAGMQSAGLLDRAKAVNGLKVMAASFGGASADSLRAMCDELRQSHADAVAVLAGVDGEKVTFAVAVGKDAQQKGANAGKIARAAAQAAGGNGGGRPDFAMAGAKKPDQVGAALDAAVAAVAEMTK